MLTFVCWLPIISWMRLLSVAFCANSQKEDSLRVHKVICVKGRRAEHTELDFTRGDCRDFGLGFSQPFLILFFFWSLLIPWQVEAGMVSQQSSVWNSWQIKAVNDELKSTTRRDPSMCPYACVYMVCVGGELQRIQWEVFNGIQGESMQDYPTGLWPLVSQWQLVVIKAFDADLVGTTTAESN